jgi:predicted ATPase
LVVSPKLAVLPIPPALYDFKHVLVQDAARGSLLRKARWQLHAKIAGALETNFPQLADSEPECFVQHYAAIPKAAPTAWE